MTYREPNRGYVLATLLARAYPSASPGGIATAVTLLQSTAAMHRRAAERECNEPMTEKELERSASRLNMAIWRVGNQMSCLGVPAHSVAFSWGGDPRGSCGSLIDATEAGDGWGNGFAIY